MARHGKGLTTELCGMLVEVDGQRCAVLSVPSICEFSFSVLSAAENRISSYVLAGLSNEQIAQKRGVSRNTVENQIASLFRKLHVSSRFELAVLAQRGELPASGD